MLSKKSKNDGILMEAYYVLLGYVRMDREGRFVAVDEPAVAFGPADGANKLRFLGVSRRKRIYESGRSNRQAVFDAGKAFRNIGKEIHFLSREDVYGCQIRTYVFYPVVLAFCENEEGKLMLTAYTARCFTSWIATRIAMRLFEKNTASFLIRDESKKEEKLAAKREKKEEKMRLKAEREARKEEEKLRREAEEINNSLDRD